MHVRSLGTDAGFMRMNSWTLIKLTTKGLRRLTVAVGLALSTWTVAHGAEFPLEWLLLGEPARSRLIETLTARGESDGVALLEAVAREDVGATEAALRRMVAASDDRRLGDALARLLDASGRSDEAEEVRSSLRARAASPRRLAAAGAVTPQFSGKTPVVFLHGFNGDVSTWKDYLVGFLSDGGYRNGDLLVFHYYDADASASLTSLDLGLAGFDYDTDVPIAQIAARVQSATTVWLRRRAGLPDDDSSHDADLPAVDWVCHSMGGLVFRHVLANRPELVRRCVTLGTPHFGQVIGGNVIIGQLVGKQAQEMAFGSPELWSLAEKWRFLGDRTDDILFVGGLAEQDGSGIWHDGLISAFSTTLQTAEDPRYAENTYYVRRVHTSVFDAFYDMRALTELAGPTDPLFRLVCGYLNGSGYFAGGGSPTQTQVLKDDGGGVYTESVLNSVATRGGLFVQVMRGETNTVGRTDRPAEYSSGLFESAKVVEALKFGTAYFGDEDEGLYRGNGYDDEGCEQGLVFLYGNIPTGDCKVLIGQPQDPSSVMAYTDSFHLAGGGVTTVRTRPRAARPQTAVSVADVDGAGRSVTVPNDWLVEKGLAGHAEDLGGCVNAASGCGANGWPVAASYLLGLDPTNEVSTLKIASFAIGNGISFAVSAGERRLDPGSAPVVLQQKRELGDAWISSPVPAGDWTLPLSDARFFRAALKW